MGKSYKPPTPTLINDKSNTIPRPGDIKQIGWSFSFKFFKQINLFGLENLDPKWFVSLIVKLSELSKTDIDYFNSSIPLKNNFRYHPIDWKAKKIPIQRSDFTWIDVAYLNNPAEYPFVQFQISQALGRVIGFWNENSELFYIILLDPMHNMQPSQYTYYKIRDSHPLSCHYTSLLIDIDKVRKKALNCPHCNLAEDLSKLPSNNNSTNAVIFFLDDDYLAELDSKLRNNSLSDIIESGIIALS